MYEGHFLQRALQIPIRHRRVEFGETVRQIVLITFGIGIIVMTHHLLR